MTASCRRLWPQGISLVAALALLTGLAAPVSAVAPLPSKAGSAAAATPAAAVDLNTATEKELTSLPGVGPATAAAIVRARSVKPFATVDELQTRGLLSPRAFADLRDLVSVR